MGVWSLFLYRDCVTDIGIAKKRALQASRNACGSSAEARYYAKLMIDRYELAMEEAGFEFTSAKPLGDNKNA
jgi:hypothetical protein